VGVAAIEEVEGVVAQLAVAGIVLDRLVVAGRPNGTVRISPMLAEGPLVIITIRSARNRASSMSWVIISTVGFCSCQMASSSSCNSSLVIASRAPKGSSRISTSGDTARARAMATR
jgi:hypothetical protein